MRNKHARRLARERRTERRAQDNGNYLLELARERPLLVAGAGIALGMAIGALLPWRELDEDLIDEGVEMVSEGYQKAKSAAQSGVEAAADFMHRGGNGSGESTSADKSEKHS